MSRRIPASIRQALTAGLNALLAPPRGMKGIIRSVPAPVGGLNGRDPLAQMKPLDAVVLENWFPRTADCVIRAGAEDYLTSISGVVETLLVYNAPVGTQKMFAATDDGIYDASSSGSVGALLVAATDGRWQSVQMGVSGGDYLTCFNGVDEAQYYNGTTWITVNAASSPAITGVLTTALIAATVYNRRLFLLEKNKLNFWYLAADAVGGAATQFLLGPVTTRGGYTMAVASWTVDGGDGPDDYIAFVTSEGEVVLYRGTNPGDAAAWSRVGTYYVGKPLGRRCFTKYAGDLVLLTQNGAFPLSGALQSATINYRLSLSDKIATLFTTDTVTYFSNFGWQGVVYPAENAFVFNIPTAEASAAEQFVMNTVTKSWTRFTGWNASCFAEYNKELYFGMAGKVAKAWTGRSDFDANIVAYAKTAYNKFGSSLQKRFGLCRPMLMADGSLTYSIGLSTDFRQETPLTPVSYSTISGGIWDVSLWDVGLWAGSLEVILNWRTIAHQPGAYAALLLSVSTSVYEVQWVTNEYFYEEGGIL